MEVSSALNVTRHRLGEDKKGNGRDVKIKSGEAEGEKREYRNN